MLLETHASIPLGTKDPREAVQSFIEQLQACAKTTSDTGLILSVRSTRYHQVINAVAEKLPDDAGFFAIRSRGQQLRKIDAAGLLSTGEDLGFCSFRGHLTQYMSLSEGISLIETLFDLRRSAIRSTSFNVLIENAAFNDIAGLERNYYSLDDRKGLGGKHRFAITSRFWFDGEGPRAKTVKQQLAHFATVTSLPFKKADIVRDITAFRTIDKPTRERLIAFAWCIEHAFASIADEFRSTGRKWQSFPNISSKSEAADYRMEAVFDRVDKQLARPKHDRVSSPKVNFISILKRFIKENFPDFAYEVDGPEWVDFKCHWRDEITLILQIERFHISGLGRTFSLKYGARLARGPLAGYKVTGNAFRMFDQPDNSPPSWAYVSAEDLGQCLVGIKSAIEATLPNFERRLAELLDPLPDSVSDRLEVRHGATSRSLMPVAEKRAGAWATDATFVNLSSYRINPFSSSISHSVDMNGAIGEAGYWVYRFYSEAKSASLDVKIPYAGTPSQTERKQTLDFEINPPGVRIRSRGLRKFSYDWMDSDHAMALALKSGAADALSRADQCFGVYMKLDSSTQDNPTMRWTVDFFLVEERARSDFSVSFDAADGGALEISTR